MKNILITILFTIISVAAFAQLPRAGSVVGLTNGDTVFQSPLSTIFSALGGGGGTTINPTNNYVPVRTSSTAFGDSPMSVLGSNVGVGIISPVEMLHVLGNIRSNARFLTGSGSAAFPAFGFADDSDIGMYRGGTNELRFSTGAADRVTITSSGNIGMGTITPASKLDVEGGVAIGATYSGTTAAPTNGAIIEGNVGIGTTTISAKLHAIATTEQQRLGYDASNYFSTTIGSTGNATLNLVGTSPEFTFSDAINVPNVAYDATTWNGNTEAPTMDAIRDKIEAMSVGGGTTINSSNGYMPYRFDGTTFRNSLIYNDSINGRVGIGTTSPTGKFQVNSSAGEQALLLKMAASPTARPFEIQTSTATPIVYANADGTFRANKFQFDTDTNTGIVTGGADIMNFQTGGSNRITLIADGSVGIGTVSPTAVLHLKAGTATASTAPLKLTSGTNLTTPEAGAVEWDGTNLFVTQTTGPTRKTLAYTTDVPSITGKVTKGGDTDAATLVVGTNDSQELHLETGGTARIYVTTTGLVGIKEPSPATTLHVNGNIRGNGKMIVAGTGNTSALTASQLGFLNTNGSSTYDVLLNDAASLEFTSNTAVKTLSLTNSGATLGGGLTVTTSTKTSSYTMAGTDYYIRIDGTSGANIITLPSATTGRVVKFKRVDNFPAIAVGFIGVINGTANPTSLSGGSPVANMTAQHAFLELTYNGTDWDITGQN